MLSRASKPMAGFSLEAGHPEPCEEAVRPSRKRSRPIVDCLRRRQSVVLLLLPAALLVSLYAVSSEDYDFAPRFPPFYGSYNVVEGAVDGYLVWNPKCQMLSKDPMDPSIRGYVKKEKFEKCADGPPLSRLTREENGSVVLSVERSAFARHPDLECCWSAVFRAEKQPEKPTKERNVDSSIVVKPCEKLQGDVALNAYERAYAALVSCSDKSKSKARSKPKSKSKSNAKAKWKWTAEKSRGGRPIYENVHAIMNAEKVRDRFRANVSQPATLSRKLSVLLLGIDSVSRLNFMRSVPNTERYLRETGWLRLNGYNKMGDNTFPNVMAILTGQSQAQASSVCKPTVSGNLDRCSFIWRNFRDAGYATAYGEDETALNTFNYLKLGFVHPPTDYYLRPYMLACEKLLNVKKRFGLKYCTGPETSFDRILDYAVEFARTFLGLPYFGFFWTISVSHENANGLSSMDDRLLDKLKRLESEGVLNDTMVVMLSDHGMRWGPIRNTFVGWYEERLPFLYFWLPEWFRDERPQAYSSLLLNQHRLTSPFDLYETLRDVLRLSGGQADRSPGCPSCQSLLAAPVPRDRGCSDAGILTHWCACTGFQPADPRDPVVHRGAQVFLEHVDQLLDGYRNKQGKRLCAKLRLKKVHRVDRVIEYANSTSRAYFYMIQVSPGDGKFEVTVRYHENGTYTVSDHQVSRINAYAAAAQCLDRGMKQYCYCLK